MGAERIFLIGMMGSGKSYWLKQMAKWNKSVGYDLDALIEMKEEKTITEIFDEDGEAYFRKSETTVLKWFKEKKKYVVATGGGAACVLENMDFMKKEAVVIWLDESVDVLVNRLSQEKAHRPLIADLSDIELKAFLEQKLVERHPFYKQAHYRLTSDQINESGLKKLIKNHAS
jgi:shikimate kinase